MRRELSFLHEPWYTREQISDFILPTTRIILLVDHSPILTTTDIACIQNLEATYESLGSLQRVWEDLDYYIDEFGQLVYVRAFLDLKGNARDIDLRYNILPDTLKQQYELSDRYSPTFHKIPRNNLPPVSRVDTKLKTV